MRNFAAMAAVTALMVGLAGCRVTEKKNGDHENVDIRTPFGGMNVKTSGDATANLGFTLYPGAVLEKKDKEGKEDGAADIDMSFGSFHLGVKAASYLTPDAPPMVIAFYKKDMARYGLVLQCDGSKAVGSVTRTADGLTCDDDSGKHRISFSADDGSASVELRAGSKLHQHILGIEKKNGQTKIGMVSLDLPSGFSKHNDKQSD
jgi:hypothetical protein